MYKKHSNTTGIITYSDYKYIWNKNVQLASQNLDIPKAINFGDSYGHRTTLPIGNYTTFIIYNEFGEAVGFSIDDGTDIKVYYYMKDVTGQIDAVVDVETNTIVYSCTYDSWGCILDEYCTDALVAYGNPLRYKDYNYDIDMDLYYLQSRYYNAAMGRFINADDPMYTDTYTGTTNSTNMYIYCENDSINYCDYDGYFFITTYKSSYLRRKNDHFTIALTDWVSTNGKPTITWTKSKSVSAEIESSVTASAKVVAATLGLTTSFTLNASSSYSWTINSTRYKYARIVAKVDAYVYDVRRTVTAYLLFGIIALDLIYQRGNLYVPVRNSQSIELQYSNRK